MSKKKKEEEEEEEESRIYKHIQRRFPCIPPPHPLNLLKISTKQKEE